MNDGLRTDVFVRYSPEAIACACIFLAARKLKIPLPESPPWYELFDVDYSSIEAISKMLLQLYSMPKPDYESLEKLCEEAKQQQLEEKRKAKVSTNPADDLSNPGSRNDSPVPKNSLGLNPLVLKKIKSEDNIRHENGSSEEKNGPKGKHRPEDSEHSHSSRSRSTRSRSPSPPSKKRRSYSRSLTPPSKKKRSYSPVRYHKRERYEDYDNYKMKRSHKHRKRVRSRSPSASPRYVSKSNKKSAEKRRRSVSPQERSRSRKHHNGQHDSSPRYDKRRR